MNGRNFTSLKILVIVLALILIGWSVYAGLIEEHTPGDGNYQAGNSFFEDELYAQALSKYQFALDENPHHMRALRGKARSLMQLGELPEALRVFNDAIAREPGYAVSYANRGIVLDLLEYYEEAVADYEKALNLGLDLNDESNWMTRLVRNQAEAPPTIADRAAYLKAQLQLPQEERSFEHSGQDDLHPPLKQ